VNELEWPPYATKAPGSTYGWVGFDIDLFSAVAERLGFTFEINEPAMNSGETYTDFLLRTATDADLWLSWWLRTPERMNGATLLFGHVDASPVLVAPPPTKGGGPPPMDTFFRPFSYPLWACIGLLIFASGLVDFALEYGYGGSFSSSIYEYFAGVLWGGFQDPHTRLSAVFQVLNALIIMIIVAAYTANLAAFLTISNTPTIGFGSTHDLIASRTAVCSIGSYGSQSTLETMFSDMSFDTSQTSYGKVGSSLLTGGCSAAILNKVDFDSLLTNGSHCQLSVVGASLYFSAAGWVTNFNNSLCLQRPIEYALHSLQADGTLDRLFQSWMPTAACLVTEQEVDGRRLAETSEGSVPTPAYAGRRKLSGRQVGHGRRLVSTTVAASSGGGSDALDTMEVENFLGVFVLWFAVSGAILLIKCLAVLAKRFGIGPAKVAQKVSSTDETDLDSVPEAVDVKPARKPSTAAAEEYQPDPSKYPPGVDINNVSAMLRYLIVQQEGNRAKEE
jgi:hypothetical protein